MLNEHNDQLLDQLTRIDESPFSSSTTDNWVARLGGLPPYIRGVCRGIMKSGKSFEEALPMAIGIMRTWAAGGPTFGKNTHASAATKAKAAAALAQWEAMKAAAGGGHREIEISTIEVRFGVSAAGNKQLAGAYAKGHPFHGNQHTGSITQSHKPPPGSSGAVGASVVKGNPVAGLHNWVVPTAGKGKGGGGTKGASGGAKGASGGGSGAGAASAKAAKLAAVDSATTAYNAAKDNLVQTKAQHAQNIAFAVARVHNTNDSALNQKNQEGIQAVKLQAQTAVVTATDHLNSAQAHLEDSMTAAGYHRDDPEFVQLRDGFAGGFIGESGSSGAANFLPTGPSTAQDAAIKAKLEKSVSKHRFKGHDTQRCSQVGCGKPITDPVHHVANASQPSKSPTLTNSQILRSAGEIRAGSVGSYTAATGSAPTMESFSDVNKRHAFKGEDMAHCQRCGQAFDAPVHGGKVVAQPIPPIPREAPGVRHSGPNHAPVPSGHVKGNAERHKAAAASANNRNINTVEGPLRRAMEAHFGEQRTSTINRLLGKRGGRMLKRASTPITHPGDIEPAGASPALNPGDVFDQSFWTSKLAGVLHPHLTTAAVLAQHEVRNQVSVPSTTDDATSTAAVQAAIAGRAQAAAQAVTATTAKQLAGALQAGVARGESRDAIAGRLGDVFDSADHARAHQIASTQAGGAYNEAGITYATHLPDGLVGSKVWLSGHDDKKKHRKSHQAANGQSQTLKAPFMIGGNALHYPGSTIAPINTWAGCRCSMGFMPGGQADDDAVADASEASSGTPDADDAAGSGGDASP